MDEDKAEAKVEDNVARESDDELSDQELSNVTGGEGPIETISFPYGHVEY